MLLPKEVWRDIPGYEGKYQVSNIGNVRSLHYRNTNKAQRLNSVINEGGYNIVGLSKDGKSKQYKVHRLVAEAFIPNPNNYPIINHKDENKTNNVVWNLEWCTYEYNNNYGTKNERASKSKKGKTSAMKGKTLSEETKKRISQTLKGHKQSIETKTKRSNSMKGKMIGNNNAVTKKVKCIETGQVFESVAEANEYLGKKRTHSGIGDCANGRAKSAHKLHWQWVTEE